MGDVVTVLHVSECRARQAISQFRSAYRYRPRRDPSQEPVRERIIAFAKAYGRYGYRTVTDLVRRAGWDVGKDRV